MLTCVSVPRYKQGWPYRFWQGGGLVPPIGGGPKGGDKGPMGGDWHVIRDKIKGAKKIALDL